MPARSAGDRRRLGHACTRVHADGGHGHGHGHGYDRSPWDREHGGGGPTTRRMLRSPGLAQAASTVGPAAREDQGHAAGGQAGTPPAKPWPPRGRPAPTRHPTRGPVAPMGFGIVPMRPSLGQSPPPGIADLPMSIATKHRQACCDGSMLSR
ncbi:hypothetical protein CAUPRSCDRAFT_12297 [Caulochytrium protostelioides]|nr:hypothetical protein CAUPRSCDRAFT_12297 [Caulochytrium protostelioides]